MKNMNFRYLIYPFWITRTVLPLSPYFNLYLCCVFYLKGSQTELDEDSGLCSRVFWQEGKHHIVHPKQWDEEQSGFGQPPAHNLKKPMRTTYSLQVICVCLCVCACHHAEGYLFSSHLKWLVSLPPTPGDLSFWTRIRITLMKMKKFTYMKQMKSCQEKYLFYNCSHFYLLACCSNQICSDKQCCTLHGNLAFHIT